MKRRVLLRHTGIAGLAAAGAAPAVHAQPSMRWRLASSFPRSLDALFGTSDVFARAVKTMTGGRFEISTHPGGELVPPFSVVDAVQAGTVQMAHTAGYYFYGKDEAFTLGCAIPFGLNSRQQSAWMTEGDGLRLMREFYANYNIVNLPGGNTGAQMGGWFRKELRGVEDLKGLKFRIPGLASQLMARLGAVPQSLPASDVYTALERGSIDAVEFGGPHDDHKLGFVKVAPYYYYPGFWEGSAQGDFFINRDAWAALSEEHKAILEAAAAQAHQFLQAAYDARNPVALKSLVSQGARLRAFPADLMRRAYQESLDMYAEISQKNPAFRKIYTDLVKFRADQNLWFRFAEMGFDRFMQAQKPG